MRAILLVVLCLIGNFLPISDCVGQSIKTSSGVDSIRLVSLSKSIESKLALGPSDDVIPLFEELLSLSGLDSVSRINYFVSYHDARLKDPTSTILEREALLSRAKANLPDDSASYLVHVAFLNAKAKEAFQQGKLDQGVSLLSSIESIFENTRTYSLARAGTLLNLGGLYVDQELFQLATPILTKAVAILDSLETPLNYYAAVNYSLGRSLLLEGDCQAAITAFRNARADFATLFGTTNHPAILSIDSYIALCQVECKDEATALALQESLVSTYLSFHTSPNSELASFYTELSASYLRNGILDSARVYHEKAIGSYDLDSLSLTSLASSSQASSSLLRLLAQQVDMCTEVDELIETLNLGVSYIHHLRQKVVSKKAALDINIFARPFVAASLKKLQGYDGNDDLNTINLFLFFIDLVKTDSIFGLPSGGSNDAIRSQISKLRDSLFLLSRSDLSIEQDITSLTLVIDSLTSIFDKRVSTQAPALFDVIELSSRYENVGESLSSSTVALSFFVDKDDIYCVTVGNGKRDSYHVSSSNGEVRKCITYANQLRVNEQSELDPLHFAVLDSILLSGYQSILIAPDDWLHSIPFDILEYDSEFLIHTFSIGYIPSMQSLFSEDANRGRGKISKVSIFSPSYVGASSGFSGVSRINKLIPLPFAKDEASFVNKLVSFSTLFSSDSISKTSLLRHLESDDVVHLALHSGYDYFRPEASSLFLNADSEDVTTSIYLRELSSLDLENDMIFLSGCESGTGVLHNGMGMMSMSQALLRAGSHSVISTFWPVDDQPTSIIVKYFYEALANGENKLDALRSAKLKYLQNHPELGVHPFYWSSLRVDGNYSGLDISTSGYFWYFVLLLGILVIIIAAFKYWR